MVKEVTMFQAADGTYHTTKEEAENRELQHKVKIEVGKLLAGTNFTDTQKIPILAWLQQKRSEIILALEGKDPKDLQK